MAKKGNSSADKFTVLLKNFYKFFSQNRLFAIILALAIILSILSPAFLSITNILNVLWSISVVGIMAVGMTFVILTAGIDLSVGSIVCITGVACALLFDPLGFSLPLTLFLVLLLGAVLGLINGMLVTKAAITPFIVTLATMAFFRGITLFVTQGKTIGVLEPEIFLELGGGKFLGIPIPLIIFVFTAIVGWFLAERTIYGRSVYLLGGNKVAARMSGINIKRVEMNAYVLSGICAAISGILLTSLVQQAGSYQGRDYEMDVIAAVVVGGTSLFGGVGGVSGSVLGAILMGIIANGLNLLNIASPYHPIVKGIVIIFAVGIEISGRRKSE
jgi:ribose transport system permease protein